MNNPIELTIRELEKRGQKLNDAIHVLRCLEPKAVTNISGGMSATARHKISMAQKKRWRELKSA